MIRVDRVIPGMLAEVIRKAPLCPEKVTFAWGTVVGPALQRATEVRLAPDGTLVVTALDAQWAGEVRRASRVILARLAPLLGDGTVKRIDVQAPSAERRRPRRTPRNSP